MKLKHRIALTLRQRPLLAPMLVVTLLVDIAVLVTAGYFVDEEVLFFGVLTPQLGLLALWLVNGFKRWLSKLVVFVLAWLTLSITIGWRDFPVIATILAAYAGAIAVLGLLVNLAVGYWRPSKQEFRFSVWQGLIAMTVVAPLSLLARGAEWVIEWDEMPILIGMIGVPVVAWTTSRLSRSFLVCTTTATIFAIPFSLAYWGRNNELDGFFLLPVVVCGSWIAALHVRPDAKLRRAWRMGRPRSSIAVPTSLRK